jgi:hypothetical protein
MNPILFWIDADAEKRAFPTREASLYGSPPPPNPWLIRLVFVLVFILIYCLLSRGQ